MAIEKEQLESMITDTFPDADINIEDLAGDNDHYRLTITAAEFQGKSRIQQHKMVYEALQGKMGTELHALAIRTIAKED